MSAVDLHDLATILLRERLLTEPRFKHFRLREVNDGSKPINCLPSHIALPELDGIPSEMDYNAYFLIKDGGESASEPAVEAKDFLHREFFNGTSSAEFSPKDIETTFWKCKHHDSGYILSQAMQMVCDTLPTGTKLKIRTSQGHSITCSSTSLNVVELTLHPHSATYICGYEPRPDLGPTKINLSHYVVGNNDGDVPWVYLVFGEDDVKDIDISKDRRVMLDLVSPMLGMRGLGGELFAMERLEDYHHRMLSEVANESEQLNLIGRIVAGPNPDFPDRRNIIQSLEAKRLCDRVLQRLERIQRGEETFCSYCGKEGTKLQCSKCHAVQYCDNNCQKSAWKYHKKWCQKTPGVDGI